MEQFVRLFHIYKPQAPILLYSVSCVRDWILVAKVMRGGIHFKGPDLRQFILEAVGAPNFCVKAQYSPLFRFAPPTV